MCSFTVLLRQHHLHWIWRKKEHINTRNSFISAQREFLYIYFFSFLLHRWEGRLFFSFSFFMNTSTRESDNKAVRADTVWMCVDAALKKSQCLSPLYLPRLLSREGVALWNIHEDSRDTAFGDLYLTNACPVFVFYQNALWHMCGSVERIFLEILEKGELHLKGRWNFLCLWVLHQQIYQIGTHVVISDAFAINV